MPKVEGLNLERIAEFVEGCGENTKVYIGTDSERFKIDGVWYADYATVVVVHKEGKHGGKVFGEIVREVDYDKKKNRPSQRLMSEVYKTAELYLKLADLIYQDIEIHLDINPKEEYGSSCVVNEAIGYIKGVCNVQPLVKPEAWCASFAADQLKRIMQNVKRDLVTVED